MRTDVHSQTDSNPLVSVAMFLFHDRYLEQAISSILNQTYKNLEVFLLDDCGPGRTEEICQAFAKKDSRVNYIRNQTNLGACRNIQKAFHQGKGTYFVGFTDDDYLAPSFIEKCVARLEAEPSLAGCASNLSLVNEKSEVVEHHGKAFQPCAQYDLPQSFEKIIKSLNRCNIFESVLRRSMVEKALPMPENINGADVVFLTELALYGGFDVIDEDLHFKRFFKNSSTVHFTEDSARGHMPNTAISQLTFLYPMMNRANIIVDRIARARLSLEMRTHLIERFMQIDKDRFHENYEAERLGVQLFLIKSQISLQNSDLTQPTLRMFCNSALEAISVVANNFPKDAKLAELALSYSQLLFTEAGAKTAP